MLKKKPFHLIYQCKGKIHGARQLHGRERRSEKDQGSLKYQTKAHIHSGRPLKKIVINRKQKMARLNPNPWWFPRTTLGE